MKSEHDINRDLEIAKAALNKRRHGDAIAIYQRMIEEDLGGKAVGAYGLGILYDGGIGLENNKQRARDYYDLAEAGGYHMATYRLAIIYMRENRKDLALAKYKAIAARNPSAAYWTYRILHENSDLLEYEGEAENYLSLAATSGHIAAKRVGILRQLMGREGVFRIPIGFIGFLRLHVEALRAVTNKDKLLYQ